jgi:hypothetical protein
MVETAAAGRRRGQARRSRGRRGGSRRSARGGGPWRPWTNGCAPAREEPPPEEDLLREPEDHRAAHHRRRRARNFFHPAPRRAEVAQEGVEPRDRGEERDGDREPDEQQARSAGPAARRASVGSRATARLATSTGGAPGGGTVNTFANGIAGKATTRGRRGAAPTAGSPSRTRRDPRARAATSGAASGAPWTRRYPRRRVDGTPGPSGSLSAPVDAGRAWRIAWKRSSRASTYAPSRPGQGRRACSVRIA